MSFSKVLEVAGIPLLMCAACAYFAFRTHLSKDPGMFVGKASGPLKNKEEYCKGAVRNLIFMAIASLLMGILLLFDPFMGLLEIVGATIIAGILWRDLNKRYGSEMDVKKK